MQTFYRDPTAVLALCWIRGLNTEQADLVWERVKKRLVGTPTEAMQQMDAAIAEVFGGGTA